MNTDSEATLPAESVRRKAFEMIAQDWTSGGILYCIANGLDKHTNSIGRDLDVLIASEHVDEAIQMARTRLKGEGWDVLEPPAIWGRRILAVKNKDWSCVIEVHTLKRISWKNVAFCLRPEPSENFGVFPLDPWCAFVKRILLPLLSGDMERFRENPSGLNMSDGEIRSAQEKIPVFCGDWLGNKLLAALKARDFAALSHLWPRLKRTIMLRGFIRTPIGSLACLLRLGIRRLKLPVSPCAPIVALVGPDGVGKSTLLSCLRSNRGVFTRVVQRHWRPSLLPPLGSLVGKGDIIPPGTAVPPRRSAGRFAPARQIYYGLDFILGYYLRDRVDSAHQRLVLYDRCSLDMTVDPLRYGLSSAKLLQSMYRLLPKPDLIILLTDDPERIHRRKPELPVPEISRQIGIWLQLVEQGKVGAVLRTDSSPEVLAGSVRQLIINQWFTGPLSDIKRSE